MTTLLYLELRQLINLLKLIRKSPRRLIPAVIFCFWIYSFSSKSFFGMQINPTWDLRLTHFGEPVKYLPFLMLALAIPAIYYLMKSFSESMIVFHLPDIDFLFAIPLNHRLIMFIKLLKVYAKVGIIVSFFTVLIMRSVRIFGDHSSAGQIMISSMAILLYAILIINACTIINLMSSFRPGGKWWVHVAARGAVGGLFLLAAGLSIFYYIKTDNISTSLMGTISNPIIAALLSPTRWTADILIHPISKHNPRAVLELIGMLILGISSFILVIIRRENPFEPSIVVSQRHAALKAAFRDGGFSKARTEKNRFRCIKAKTILAPFGTGALAILWKNITVLYRGTRETFMIILVLITGVLLVTRYAFPDRFNPHDIAMAVVVGMSYLIFLGSGFMLQSLRNDMKQANILKTMPIRAWKIILAHTAQGTIAMTVLGWATIALVALIYGLEAQSPLLIAMLILPWVVHAALSSQVALAITYPNWDDVSQRYIGGMLSMLGNIITIVPAVTLAIVFTWYGVNMGIAVFTIVLLEIGLSAAGIGLGASAYNRYDPTNE